MRHEITSGKPMRRGTAVGVLATVAALAIGAAILGIPREASAQSSPLGNATFGTSTGGGAANGVQSPSGPGVHPGYRLVSFRDAIGVNWRFGGMDWLSDGRMVVVIWGNDVSYQTGGGHQANGIYGDVGLDVPNGGGPGWMNLISNVQGTGGITPADTTRIYTGLWEPLGLVVGRSGNPATDTIYVMTKTGLLRFIGTGPYTNGVNPIKVVKTCANRTCAAADSAGPGIYRSFTTHAPVNYSTMSGRRWHHFNFGLTRGNDGYLYGGTGVQYDNGNDRYEQGRDRCGVLKMDPNAGTVQVVAGGLRSPNGFSQGPDGEIFFPDIQGNYNPANTINNYRPGRYYGFRCDTEQPYGHTRGLRESFPAVALNQGATATAIGVNPGGMAYLTTGPYAGQMLIGDVSFGGIQRVFLEKIQGEWQGAIMLFSGGFRSGIGRLLLGPDGSIYAGGQSGGTVQASGNWCWGGAGGVGALTADRGTGGTNTNCNVQRDFFKLVPKDTTVFEVLAARARVGGFELQFTKKVGPSAGVASNYTVRTWTNNLSSQTYGGGALQGNVLVGVNSVRIHPDSMRVFLELATMPAASVRPEVPAATAPTGNAPANGGNVRVVNIKATGVLAADGSTPWGEPVTAGAAPSRLAVWYTLNYHSIDTAFTPVALVDSRLALPENRARDFRVRYAGGALLLKTNFAQPVRFTVRDLRGRPMASRSVAPGVQDVSLSVAHLARGSYVVEARVAGQTFARPVAIY